VRAKASPFRGWRDENIFRTASERVFKEG